MGWCHEFGPQIAESCEHPMTAHSDHCECTVCGTVCTGRFAGCGAVWARGPREVAVNAPRARSEEGAVAVAETDRWRLPLEAARATLLEPATITEALADPEPEPEPEPTPEPEVQHAPVAQPAPAPPEPVPAPAFESPDVTTRYAVAQLQDLNDRVAGLTEEMTARTELALQNVATELRRLTSQREIDLTEQAAGIFGAVQAGADALAAFSKTVGEVTDDLRAILNDALKAIGGTDGLAAWVAASASDIAETRQEFADSLAKIQRDMTLLRRRANADSKPAKLDDDQVAFIVDAVTDSVLAALESKGRRR